MLLYWISCTSNNENVIGKRWDLQLFCGWWKIVWKVLQCCHWQLALLQMSFKVAPSLTGLSLSGHICMCVQVSFVFLLLSTDWSIVIGLSVSGLRLSIVLWAFCSWVTQGQRRKARRKEGGLTANGGCLQVDEHDWFPQPNLRIFSQHYSLILKKTFCPFPFLLLHIWEFLWCVTVFVQVDLQEVQWDRYLVRLY